MAKMTWLTEQAIGDLLWKDWDAFFEPFCEEEKHFREFEIGRGRIDFATFRRDPNIRPSIDLFELKITASYDSITQLIKYSRDLGHYHANVFYGGIFKPEQIPKISLNLIARFFDHKIIDICSEFNIALWRVEPLSKNAIKFDLEIEAYPEAPSRPDLEKQLVDFFGVKNGQN